MVSAANQDAYPNAGWSNGPWGAGPNQARGNQSPPWNGDRRTGDHPWAPPFWHPDGMSRPVAIAFTILGFMFWWPVGLAILFYTLGSRRMGCFGRRRQAMYQAQNGQAAPPWADWKSWACGTNSGPSARAGAGTGASSGNHAFDEYKAETLRRLEEEQQEFGSFLERLRFAKDKAEFDQFMAERRSRPPAPPSEEPASA